MDELRERVSARELLEWFAFEVVFGPITVQERIDAAAGIGAWAARSAMGEKDKTPRDFMPDWARIGGGEEKAVQSDDEIMAAMRGFQRRGKVPSDDES